MQTIHTGRLDLVPATDEIREAELRSDREFGALLNAEISVNWPPEPYEPAVAGATLGRLQLRPESGSGWMWYVLERLSDGHRARAIGVVGYRGSSETQGTVEIACGIVAERQRRGFATEAARALVHRALALPEVRRVVADARPDRPGFIGVLEACGFRFAGEGTGPGVVRYELRRGDAAAGPGSPVPPPA